jgi:hypothetical protein
LIAVYRLVSRPTGIPVSDPIPGPNPPCDLPLRAQGE